MNIRKILSALLALVLVCGCNSDPATDNGKGNGGGTVDDNLPLTPSTVSVKSSGGVFEITAKEDLGWGVSSKSQWINFVGASADVFTFSVDKNPSDNERRGTVGFVNAEKERVFITVVQSGPSGDGNDEPLPSDPVFSVPLSSLIVSPDEGAEFDVLVRTNTGGTVTSLPDWLTFVDSSTPAEAEVLYRFRTHANTSASSREGTVSIRNNSGRTNTIYITQAGRRNELAGDGREWTQRALHRRSLYIDFTATWCGNCPRMAKGMAHACEQMQGKIEPLGLHCFNSDFDLTSGTDPLAARFGITALPAGVVDMATSIPADTYTAISYYAQTAVRQTEALYPTSAGIELESSLSEQTLSADVKLYVKYAGQYKITVMLVEDGIVHAQKDYDLPKESDQYNYGYVHNHVARACLTGRLGDDFVTAQNFEEKSFSFSAQLSSSWNRNNLSVLVYVERAFGSQQKVQSGDFGDYYVDNCLSAAVGTKVELELD